MPTSSNTIISTAEIREILRAKFPPAEYALLEEVSNAAGFGRSRSADFVFIGLWPSRGHALNVVELKRSRTDWLSELKNPAKADSFFKYCHHFWLLTADPSIAKPEEIPAAWGWMSMVGKRLKVLKPAPGMVPLEPISYTFLAALLKRATDKQGWIRKEDIQDQIEQAFKQGVTEGQSARTNIQSNLEILRSEVDKFETESGIKITQFPGWSHGNKITVAAAVKVIMEGGVDGLKKDLQAIQGSVNRLADKVNLSLKELNSPN